MHDLVGQIEKSILERKLFRPGQSILVAVSGGLDSMVLLHGLHELARKHRWSLTVAHLNHLLRGRSSALDQRLVGRVAHQLHLPFATERANVRAFAKQHKLSIEMAARQLRHDFLARTAAQRRIPTIALAHHADDQLELFFLRLLRGSGPDGLAGMKWRSPSPSDPSIVLARPLLDLPKSALREFAAQRKIPFREDASNECVDFPRNRIRHELLPLLRRHYATGLDKAVSRLMEILSAEAEFVAQAAQEWLAFNIGPNRRRVVALSGAAFEDLPLALQRRVLQIQLLNLGCDPGFDLIEELRLHPERPIAVPCPRPLPIAVGHALRARRAQPKRITAAKHAHWTARFLIRTRIGSVRLQTCSRTAFLSETASLDLNSHSGSLVFSSTQINWRTDTTKTSPARLKPGSGLEWFDADRVSSPVLLRHWRPGDRFQPIGMKTAIKLQDFFTNEKIPAARRRELILAEAANGTIFWVEGMRIAEQFKLTKLTRRRLEWSWTRLLPDAKAQNL